jgi:hypothetical protein
MSRLVRNLIVTLALGIALIPTSAFAASAPTTPLQSIEDCVAPHMTQATHFRLTLAQAQQCAAGIAGASAVRASRGQDGYRVVITTTSPATAVSTSSSSYCYWRQEQLVSQTIMYLAQTMCYNHWTAWVSGGASQNCHQYVPVSWCNTWNYYYNPASSTAYAEVDGNYWQTCEWIFGCFDRLYMDQWYDGSFHVGWWGM